MRLEPKALRSRVEHSTTEPLRSLKETGEPPQMHRLVSAIVIYASVTSIKSLRASAYACRERERKNNNNGLVLITIKLGQCVFENG